MYDTCILTGQFYGCQTWEQFYAVGACGPSWWWCTNCLQCCI